MTYNLKLPRDIYVPDSLSDLSRVWIYQSDRAFTEKETEILNSQLQEFIQSWTSHNYQLKAYGQVYYHRFIVIFLDEEASANAGGCSIDKLVRFIEYIGQERKVELMNRQLFFFLKDDNVFSVAMQELGEWIKTGKLTKDDLVFDALVKNKGLWKSRWIVPLSESWHARFI